MANKKKEQLKIQVIREYTESDIKGLGSAYLLKKKAKVWWLILGCAVVISVLLSRAFKPNLVAGLVAILPILIAFGFFWYKSRQMGEKIWKHVMNQPQPVKLNF